MSNPDHYIPSSVYRLQFSEDFTFKKARAILPYLKELGIETVYCSPIYDAYSSHGYDVTNPNKLNSVLGTEKEFESFCAQLQKLSMGQMIDVVPNHMGFKGGKNHWWQDVLENGPHSSSASFFDIDWNSEKEELQNKVLLPILGRPYGKALEKQEIVLHYADGEFVLRYGDYLLPVAPETYHIILQDAESSYPSLVEFFQSFPSFVDKRATKKEEGKKLLLELTKGSKKGFRWLQGRVDWLNGKKRFPRTFDALDRLLDGQYYRLSYWKVASHEINYRRFFNINELVAICIEYPHVLEAHHQWLFELIKNGSVQAMRIDHPDGLYDPDAYFKTLRNHHKLFTVVEKILDRKETLPDSWQVEGSVGYEYLNVLNGLFIRQDKERDFTEIYEEFVHEKVDFEEILYQSKKLFTTDHMASEVESLGLMLDRLSEANRDYRDFTRSDLTQALQEVIAFFPVYRTYIGPTGGVGKRDAQYISIAIEKAKSRSGSLDPSIYDFLQQLLLCKLKVKPEEEAGYREFILRFQQLTGPIMAKGMEDTSFYLYNRFLSLNEVGGAPTHFGHSVSDFHRFNKEKHSRWPFGLLASSTHDTKRSEDVRMRINVLSEIPERWQLEVKKWRVVNAKHKIEGAPSANTEYFIYQTVVGVWPRRPLKGAEWKGFIERVWQIILKSLREGRKETSWVRPNVEYEESVRQFLFAILSPQRQNPFLKLFGPFQKEIDNLGSWNSLSASALKIASCGVVDIYQGNEMFNYRGVDPDNRQPIEYDIYKKNLTLVKKQGFIAAPKLFVQWKALNFRKEHSALFLEGEYHPLRVRGHRKENVVAFYRRLNQKVVLVATGRFFASLVHSQWEKPIGKIAWGDTQILVPKEWLGKELTDLFTEKEVKVKRHGKYIYISVAELFKSLPFVYAYAFEN